MPFGGAGGAVAGAGGAGPAGGGFACLAGGAFCGLCVVAPEAFMGSDARQTASDAGRVVGVCGEGWKTVVGVTHLALSGFTQKGRSPTSMEFACRSYEIQPALRIHITSRKVCNWSLWLLHDRSL